MRSSSTVLLALLAVACAPGDRESADTSAVPVVVDSASTMSATGTPLPADSTRLVPTRPSTPTTPSASSTSPSRATSTVTGRAATDTSTGPRIRPPTKAPGGYIIVPPSAHDSLRRTPPAGTSTRP